MVQCTVCTARVYSSQWSEGHSSDRKKRCLAGDQSSGSSRCGIEITIYGGYYVHGYMCVAAPSPWGLSGVSFDLLRCWD